MSADFLPAATIAQLQWKSRLLRETREFFHASGYWEVETPLVSHDTVVDVYLEPFTVTGDGGGETGTATCYLQTSPEFCMKRLMAAGAERIYQITRAFRQGESGVRHNPEFTILEWYAAGEDHFQQMDFVESFCRRLFQVTAREDALPASFRRMSYDEAFQAAMGVSVLGLTARELGELARQKNLVWENGPLPLNDVEQKDEWLNLLLVECVEPWLKQLPAVFIYDYPVSQAALARANPQDSRVAERFELYLEGVEICNGYHELTDAEELRQRNLRQNQLRQSLGLTALPVESRLLEAMRHGLPHCSGVAVGLDRLFMKALGESRLDSLIAFPISRA